MEIFHIEFHQNMSSDLWGVWKSSLWSSVNWRLLSRRFCKNGGLNPGLCVFLTGHCSLVFLFTFYWALLWLNPHFLSYLSRWLCKNGGLNPGLCAFLTGHCSLVFLFIFCSELRFMSYCSPKSCLWATFWHAGHRVPTKFLWCSFLASAISQQCISLASRIHFIVPFSWFICVGFTDFMSPVNKYKLLSASCLH
jgi:hypothetical protein